MNLAVTTVDESGSLEEITNDRRVCAPDREVDVVDRELGESRECGEISDLDIPDNAIDDWKLSALDEQLHVANREFRHGRENAKLQFLEGLVGSGKIHTSDRQVPNRELEVAGGLFGNE